MHASVLVSNMGQKAAILRSLATMDIRLGDQVFPPVIMLIRVDEKPSDTDTVVVEGGKSARLELFSREVSLHLRANPPKATWSMARIECTWTTERLNVSRDLYESTTLQTAGLLRAKVSLCQVTGSELSEVITSAEVPFGKLAMSEGRGPVTHRQTGTAIYAIVGVLVLLGASAAAGLIGWFRLRNQRRPAAAAT